MGGEWSWKWVWVLEKGVGGGALRGCFLSRNGSKTGLSKGLPGHPDFGTGQTPVR